MEIQNTQRVSTSFPWLTIVVIIGGLGTFFFPELPFFMRYDRAAILHGEVWRLFTGHAVHFSGIHLCYDLLAFAGLGWLIEGRERRRDYGILLLAMALSISGGLLLLKPGMSYYGGLSGLACGLFVYLALSELKRAPAWRPFWGISLGLLMTKIIFEAYTRRSIFYASRAILVMWESHAIGSFVAVAMLFILRSRRVTQ